ATSADALRDEVASMKTALSSLEHQQPNIQQSAQIKSEESETRIQRRMDEMDVLLKHFFERVDGNEKLCEKLRQQSEDLTSRFETLQTHVDVGFSGESGASSFRPQPRMPQQIAEEVHFERFEEEAKAQEIIETPNHRSTSGVQMFQMTPQRDGAEDPWQKDAVDEWLDQEEDPQVVQSATAEPPGLRNSGAKIPAGQWKLIKDFPKLTIPHGEPWEKGMVFRQWCTEAASDAISPSFAPFFRKRVQAVSSIALMETVSEATSHRIILQGVACYAQELETGQATRGSFRSARTGSSRVDRCTEQFMPTAGEKHALLGTRLSLLRLQHNIQVPSHDGVTSFLQVLEAECTRIQAEEQASSSCKDHRKHEGDEYAIPSANQATGRKGVGAKPLCSYFNTARGCLKGADCEVRHEKIANKGKGAKGKGGKDGKDTGNPSSDKGKPSSKGDAKATADAKAAEEAKAKAAQEAKAKAKAEKRAAKAAAKAAASAKASSVVTVASAVSEEVPSLVGAVGLTSSRSTAPRIMMAQSPDCESDDVSGSESLESEIPMRAE
ncbi:GIP, partial [Symbiodinium necroappetens]